MKRVRLLVEGKHDDGLVKAVMDRIDPSLQKSFDIAPKGGIEPLLKGLPLELRERPPVLAVLCDSDENPASRWEEIRETAAKERLELPTELPPEGLLFNEPQRQKFGCWIMPDNRSQGSIEGVLLNSVMGESQTSLKEHSRSFVRNVPERLFAAGQAAEQKATLRAWMAIQEEPLWLPRFAVQEAFLLPELDIDYPLVRWLIALKQLL